jgi:glycosyltransferase involved in cell wall biosynthesis
MGHEVAVVTSDHIFPFSDEIKASLESAGLDTSTRKRPRGRSELDGIEVHRLPKIFEGYYDFVAVMGVKEALKQLRPDVVHAHETIQGTPAIAALHKKLGFKLVVDHHGYAPSYGEGHSAKEKLTQLEYKLIRKPIANQAFKRADAIVAVTARTKEFLVEYHKVAPERITVLPLAVDSDTFKFDAGLRKKHRADLKLKSSDVVLITTGRLDPAKQLDLFIEAFCELNITGSKFIIIGSGKKDFESKLKDLGREKCGDERLHFMPFLPMAELPGWYSAADVGIWGKASITMIEGMACRLPIIIPDQTSVKHLVSHNNGIAFKSNEVNIIQTCMEDLLENSKKRKQMGRASEKAVLKEYNYRRRTEKLMEIYESIMNNA